MFLSSKWLKIWLGLILFATLSLVIIKWQWPDDDIHLIMCDVGQGDAFLITQGFTQILIDTGPDKKVLKCLGKYLPFWDRSLELVIATHPDNDHIGGFTEILERYFVQSTVMLPIGKNSASFMKLREALLEEKRQGMQFIFPQNGESVRLGQSLEVTYLIPEVEEVAESALWTELPEAELSALLQHQETVIEDYNDLSIGSLFTLNGMSFLATGDQPIVVELALITQVLTQPVDILKVSHHGSKTGTNLDLAEKLQPEISLISCGQNNSYGHPNSQVVDTLVQIGSQIYRTDEQSTVELTFHSHTYSIQTSQ